MHSEVNRSSGYVKLYSVEQEEKKMWSLSKER